MQLSDTPRRAVGVAAMIVLLCSPLAACGGSAQSSTATSKPDVSAQLTSAMKSFHDYLAGNADMLVTATKAFTSAVRSGDTAKAKQEYVIAHPYHERVETITDNFGDLDTAIDQRPAAGTDLSTVTGFHRLERALWGDKSVSGLSAIADKLDTDVATLRDGIHKTDISADEFLKGASALMLEVGNRNTSQDEDAFSHTDLYDIAGNVEGAEKGFTLLEPAISARDSALADQIKQKFTAADGLVAKFKQGDTYPDFTTVSAADRQAIGNAIKEAGQSLGQVGSVLT